ncbi:Protein of unknown function C-terminus [Saccharopolyspora antimicrobica]|uniref:Uncharacterized protein DUF2399 n=1 Tax=Saccharopolyspora antimicrobica TaxID=455193 RepID=A0A1I4VK19_9PSEU|nr:DUF4365 domain-containing protein [Saccharopolyspora antimicrobica]RKT86347.1 uncharacterized protein DUF2399 [Saccharopolyspora antimicrobica]SFN01435.1 Protein of unknown function C-terminus [Saccharopolyspora antimicrobica]
MTDSIGRAGVYGVGLIVSNVLQWKFREQHESDCGIDAILEVAMHDRPTGQLLAIQIKSGASYFREPTPSGSGWVFRESRRPRLLDYWLSFDIPVLVVLYDSARQIAYWQQVTSTTATRTHTGFKLIVPRDHRLDASADYPLRAMSAAWTPERESGQFQIVRAVAACRAAGLPVVPSSQLWQTFNSGSAEVLAVDRPALAHQLPLRGDARAVYRSNEHSDMPAQFDMQSLSGSWHVAQETTVYVCENPIVMHTAAAKLGQRCKPLICLNGYPSRATKYLLLGLAGCGARMLIHPDHDALGKRLIRDLSFAAVAPEPWRHRCVGSTSHHEERCLDHMLSDLAIES